MSVEDAAGPPSRGRPDQHSSEPAGQYPGEPSGQPSREPSGPEIWSRVAPTYATTFARYTALAIEPLLDQASVAAGMDVLDLACGPGYAAAGALRRGARSSGLDFSREMISIAMRNVPGARFVHGDACELPWAEECFDVVVSNFGVHTFAKPARALIETRRVLKEGGRFAFTVWDASERSVAQRLLEEAVRAHGVGSVESASLSEFADPATAARRLRDAGFVDPGTRSLDLMLRAANAAEIFEVFRTGTIRLAALLSEQPADALARIRAAFERSMEPWRTGSGVAVPMRAVLTVASRPLRRREGL